MEVHMGNDLNADYIYSELIKTYYMPESYERWKDYRCRVTDYIIKYAEPGKTLAIIGVGDSNDIDLARLYKHIGNLALYDIDLDSVGRALKKYDLIGKPDIFVDRCDLFGATKKDYLDLINICLKDIKKLNMEWSPYVSSEKYLSKLSEIFKRINGSATYITNKKYDYTIMLGVHSQILAFSERIWRFFLEAAQKSDTVVPNRVHEENDLLMPRINDAILDMTKERAFIGGELTEIGLQYNVEGALQGIMDIQKRIDNGELKFVVMYGDIWPHRNGVEYNIVIYVVDKK